jgi:hypothetical protein
MPNQTMIAMFIFALPDIVLDRMKREPEGWSSMARHIVSFCDFAIQNYDWYGVDGSEDIYGDVRGKYRALRSMATELAENESIK